MNFEDFDTKNLKIDNIRILRKLKKEKKYEEIRIIAKIENTEKIYRNFFITFALKTNDLIYLNYLFNSEKFKNLITVDFNMDKINGVIRKYATIENVKIIFYPRGIISRKTMLLFHEYRFYYTLLTRCDLFDQFLTYSPSIIIMSNIIRHTSTIDLNNWVKICNNYTKCFELIPDYSLIYRNIEELYLYLIAIGYGKKIDPLNNINIHIQIVLNNWYYLDMDNFFSKYEKFKSKVYYLDLSIKKILSKKPKTVYDICNDIINNSTKNNCFSAHKYDIMIIFQKMSEIDKTIFRNLVNESNFRDSHKKYLINRSYLRHGQR